jgi:hypothetical protein
LRARDYLSATFSAIIAGKRADTMAEVTFFIQFSALLSIRASRLEPKTMRAKSLGELQRRASLRPARRHRSFKMPITTNQIVKEPSRESRPTRRSCGSRWLS